MEEEGGTSFPTNFNGFWAWITTYFTSPVGYNVYGFFLGFQVGLQPVRDRCGIYYTWQSRASPLLEV